LIDRKSDLSPVLNEHAGDDAARITSAQLLVPCGRTISRPTSAGKAAARDRDQLEP
jgi:hypothetical protein